MGSTTPAPLSRIRVTNDLGGLRIEFPIKRSWRAVLILGLPLVLLIWGLFTISTDEVLLFWLFGLLIIGAIAYPWLAMFVGRETIIVGESTLTRRRTVFGIGRTARFELNRIRDLRVAPEKLINFGRYVSFRAWYERASAERSPWTLFGEGIAFEHGAETRRIGTGLDDTEAEYVLGLIRPRLGSAGE